MRVLITGGAGFGFTLRGIFKKKGYNVRLLDIAAFPKEEYDSKWSWWLEMFEIKSDHESN